MDETPKTRAVVRHRDDVETEGWIDENGTRLTWHTLLTGPRDGTRGMSAGITEMAPTKDGIIRGAGSGFAERPRSLRG